MTSARIPEEIKGKLKKKKRGGRKKREDGIRRSQEDAKKLFQLYPRGRAVPAGVVIVLGVDEAAGLQLTAHHGGGAVIARGVLTVPVQLGVPIDPGDWKSTIKECYRQRGGAGNLWRREQQDNHTNSSAGGASCQNQALCRSWSLSAAGKPSVLLVCPLPNFSTCLWLSFWAGHKQYQAWKSTIKVSDTNKKLCQWEGTNKSSLSLARTVPAAQKSWKQHSWVNFINISPIKAPLPGPVLHIPVPCVGSTGHQTHTALTIQVFQSNSFLIPGCVNAGRHKHSHR